MFANVCAVDYDGAHRIRSALSFKSVPPHSRKCFAVLVFNKLSIPFPVKTNEKLYISENKKVINFVLHILISFSIHVPTSPSPPSSSFWWLLFAIPFTAGLSRFWNGDGARWTLVPIPISVRPLPEYGSRFQLTPKNLEWISIPDPYRIPIRSTFARIEITEQNCLWTGNCIFK